MTEAYFLKFREKIIGIDQTFETPFGEQKILYADWIASGRMYAPIEDKIRREVLPFVGNTHTETTVTGTAMTKAYHHAKEYIKRQVNANANDCLIFCGSGMTGAISKMQRILGLKIPDRVADYASNGKGSTPSKALIEIEEENRPVVFITHMEHHSNHTSWLETIADLEIIQPTQDGQVDLEHLSTCWINTITASIRSLPLRLVLMLPELKLHITKLPNAFMLTMAFVLWILLVRGHMYLSTCIPKKKGHIWMLFFFLLINSWAGLAPQA